MTERQLSPSAQAVLDAFLAEWPDEALEQDRRCLRAVAERNEYKPDMRDEMEVMFSEGWNSHRKELLAIADELEETLP